MQLGDFLTKHAISMARFAKMVGTTTATISRIADGSVMPRKALIVRIHEVTGGRVTANDLVGTYCTEPCPTIGSTKGIRDRERNWGGTE